MKNKFLIVALVFFAGIAFSSCFHDHGNISISVNDDEDVYRMRASFDKERTRSVQRIINAHLKNQHSLSFVHGVVDRDVTLDDGTNFHIKTKPGRLKISFDKDENSQESCERLMEMCDEIKDVIAREDHNE